MAEHILYIYLGVGLIPTISIGHYPIISVGHRSSKYYEQMINNGSFRFYIFCKILERKIGLGNSCLSLSKLLYNKILEDKKR